jgi:hypothetical protein
VLCNALGLGEEEEEEEEENLILGDCTVVFVAAGAGVDVECSLVV